MTKRQTAQSKQALTYEQRQKVLDQIDKLNEQMPPEISPPVTHITETTVEGLRSQYCEQKGCASILAAEGATQFEILSGLYSDKTNLDLFLNGHAADDVRVQRAGATYLIPRPSLTLGICVQPGVISSFGEQNKKQFRGRGLLGRFMFAFPASNVGSRDVRRRTPIPQSITDKYSHGIHALLDACSLINKELDSKAKTLILSPEARESWLTTFAQLEEAQRPGGDLAQLTDWAGKAHGLMLRLAGLLHVARYEGQPVYTVDICDVETAGKLVKLLAYHTRVSLDLIGNDAVVADAKYAVEWIKQNTRRNEAGAWYFKRSDLFLTPRFKNSKVDRLVSALENLKDRHIISGRQQLSTKKPTYVYYVNPAVMEATGI